MLRGNVAAEAASPATVRWDVNRGLRRADKNVVNSIDDTGGAKERRRAARQALVTKALVTREREGGPPRRATLADISLLGVGFDIDEAIEVGSRCRVRVEAGPMQLSAKVTVVNCRRHGDGYRVGCEFVLNEVERVAGAGPADALRDWITQPAES